jgi:hypothetical protein
LIIKLTDEKDLFSIIETNKEKEWFKTLKSQPLSIQIMAFNHMYQYSEEWNKEHIGNYMWYRFKHNEK